MYVELGVRPVVPFDHQGRQPFLRSPHMIGHDGDGVVEPYNLTHALDALGRGVVDALQSAAKTGDCARVAIFTPGGRTSMP
jgi:hypothetical protein